MTSVYTWAPSDDMTGGSVLAEPAYILLAEAGIPDAHERLRRITLAAEAEGLSFHEALVRDPATCAILSERLAALGLPSAAEFFSHPESYRGRAPEKARVLGEKYRALMGRFALR